MTCNDVEGCFSDVALVTQCENGFMANKFVSHGTILELRLVREYWKIVEEMERSFLANEGRECCSDSS